MTAATTSRNTDQLGTGPIPDIIAQPIAASTTCYGGTIGCVNASGLAVPGSTSTTLRCIGRVRKTVNNSAGAASAQTVEFERGVFKYGNSASTDAIAQADVMNACFIVDDQTVAKTDGSGTRSRAGIVINVDADGDVWVLLGA